MGMSVVKFLFMSCSVVFLIACHPLSMFRPAPLKNLATNSKSDDIHVAIDERGIPFIKANNIENAVYALGFMHARDRIFQLDMTRHAALGRLSELFGKRTLNLDRKYRLLSYKLKEQLAYLSREENALLTAYVQGVNDGASARKKSAEHFFLGVKFETFTVEHALAIARLQSWQLGNDLWTELFRLRVARSTAPIEVKAELISAVDDQNSAIIRTSYAKAPEQFLLPSYVEKSSPKYLSVHNDDEYVPFSFGASNAWAIGHASMNTNHALLMNDPHLLHVWPSNFYLATIQAGHDQASGASLVGVPSIAIGASAKTSWGVTASYGNTQDAVLLMMDKSDKETYWVDGQKKHLKPTMQRFCLDKKGSCLVEKHYESMFGPVIDSRFDPSIAASDHLAVMWTGFLVEHHQGMSHNFVQLMQARNAQEAVEAAHNMTLPGVNLVIADTKGAIAYAYAGLIPRRDPTQNPYLPLDGAKSSSLWSGVWSKEEKPKVLQPSEDFIVTANQNIYEHGTGMNWAFGQIGAPPYRALRIRERLKHLQEHKKMDVQRVQEIQLDDHSIEAHRLSPSFGRLCAEQFAHGTASKKAFARVLSEFDGSYTTASVAALPFEIMLKEIIAQKMASIVGNPAEQRIPGPVNFAITESLYQAITGQNTALFTQAKTAQNWEENIKAACEPAYKNLVAKAGKATWQWRWGRHHYIYRQSPLGQAWLVGGFFRDRKREVPGTAASPYAEGGTPVLYGANLRFVASMSDPPQLNIILDSGNSGVVGHTNALDQVEAWHAGKTVALERNWSKAHRQAKVSFVLPSPAPRRTESAPKGVTP